MKTVFSVELLAVGSFIQEDGKRIEVARLLVYDLHETYQDAIASIERFINKQKDWGVREWSKSRWIPDTWETPEVDEERPKERLKIVKKSVTCEADYNT